MKAQLISLLWKIKYSILKRIGAKTCGARVLVIRDNKVLLITHTYKFNFPKRNGWCSIGGGIDKGETALEAIIRELREEAGVIPINTPKLFAVYLNTFMPTDDHVIFYIVDEFVMVGSASPEIKEKKWFDLDDLPKDITPATQRRIDEYLGKVKISDQW